MSSAKQQDKTLLARGKRYRDAAAVVLGNIALDAKHAAALDTVTHATGESRAAAVRRLIIEAGAKLGTEN